MAEEKLNKLGLPKIGIGHLPHLTLKHLTNEESKEAEAILTQTRYVDGVKLLETIRKDKALYTEFFKQTTLIKLSKPIEDPARMRFLKKQIGARHHRSGGHIVSAKLYENRILRDALSNEAFVFDFRQETFNAWGPLAANKEEHERGEKLFRITTTLREINVVLTTKQFFTLLDLFLDEIADRFNDSDTISDLIEYIQYNSEEVK